VGEHFYVIMDGLCGVYIAKFKDDFSNLFCCKTLGIGKSFGGIYMILDFRIGFIIWLTKRCYYQVYGKFYVITIRSNSFQ